MPLYPGRRGSGREAPRFDEPFEDELEDDEPEPEVEDFSEHVREMLAEEEPLFPEPEELPEPEPQPEPKPDWVVFSDYYGLYAWRKSNMGRVLAYDLAALIQISTEPRDDGFYDVKFKLVVHDEVLEFNLRKSTLVFEGDFSTSIDEKEVLNWMRKLKQHQLKARAS